MSYMVGGCAKKIKIGRNNDWKNRKLSINELGEKKL